MSLNINLSPFYFSTSFEDFNIFKEIIYLDYWDKLTYLE
jgi:hypothetical protein